MTHPSSSPAVRPGTALLEALVAVTILSISGIGMVTHVAQTIASVRSMNERDRQARAAAEELQRVLLWTQSELGARAGRTRTTCCDMDVRQLSPTLYRVALADTATGSFILETSVYARLP